MGKAAAQATPRTVGANTTAATATPQGWVARALSRGTRSEEREYVEDYSKRDLPLHNVIAGRVSSSQSARTRKAGSAEAEGGTPALMAEAPPSTLDLRVRA